MDTQATNGTSVTQDTPDVKRKAFAVSDELWSEMRITAIRLGLSIGQAVEQAFLQYVANKNA